MQQNNNNKGNAIITAGNNGIRLVLSAYVDVNGQPSNGTSVKELNGFASGKSVSERAIEEAKQIQASSNEKQQDKDNGGGNIKESKTRITVDVNGNVILRGIQGATKERVEEAKKFVESDALETHKAYIMAAIHKLPYDHINTLLGAKRNIKDIVDYYENRHPERGKKVIERYNLGNQEQEPSF